MRTLLTGILVATVMCGISIAVNSTGAQDAGAAAPGQPTASAQSGPGAENKTVIRIAPGSIIPVELTKSIDAKKVKAGDEVEAKVTQDLKADDGELILPKDTKVLGRVTQAQARNKQQKESQLGILFERASLKNGEAIPLSLSIQAVIAPPSLNPGVGMAGGNPGQSSSTQGAGGMSPGTPGMSGAGAGSAVPAPPSNTDSSGNLPAAGSAFPAITANTQGVIGISHLSLSSSPDKTQGAILSSEKNNVKLESGTLMLLRVNPDSK